MALVRHIYGRTITFRYIPLAENEPYDAYQLVSARIYGPNSYPSDAQIANTAAGHVSQATSWTQVNEEGTGPDEFEIVFPAIIDSIPSTKTDYDLFYVAVNFRAESGGPVIYDPTPEQLAVYRPDGLTSKIRVPVDMVYRLDSRLAEVAPSDAWMEDKIQAAIDEILERFEGRGYQLRRMFNLEKLNGSVAMLACFYGCLDRYTEGDTSWKDKADLWRARSDELLAIAKVGFDSAGGDTPSPQETVATGAVIWVK